MTADKASARDARQGDSFSAEEREAMKARAVEMRASTKRRTKADKAAENLANVVEAIAGMPENDRKIAGRIHDIIADVAPLLSARTWYGMPAYAKDDKVVCFFQPASKFGVRYGTLGFQDVANLDDGLIWPTSYAVTELTPEVEATIADLVRRAVG